MGNCVGRQRRERPTAPGHPRKRADYFHHSSQRDAVNSIKKRIKPERTSVQGEEILSPCVLGDGDAVNTWGGSPASCPSWGRNEPLKKERLKWKSDYPMTDGQLRSKRDEFWDTAPAFEGRKEIWDALKAAAYAAEANDHELAQAILDGASITLPHGTLCECYDELGNRYQLPIYCLSPPVNLLLEHTEEENLEPPEPTPSVRREFPLKVRLSTGKDVRLSASLPDTVGQLKRQLHAQEGIEPSWQRWFFSGKLLTDRTRLQETKIQKDFVIQVIINQPPPPQD
ncbi:ubiquitin domain-containing protein 1 isoform X1 [Lagenorhynchus albirostris]|uniref:ubiquitin domain-containing protein 1 isoform X1 n=2 Tax=Lagenorhynchus albirostris TaxID=27610 RepID=UPI0028F09ED7|nr:ubiquitin domain-containing protein 1 isoform X1 [Lagenorhynchus albirostris]